MLAPNEKTKGFFGNFRQIVQIPEKRGGSLCDIQIKDPASMADAIPNGQLPQEGLSALFPSA